MTKKISECTQQKQQWQIIVEKWKQQENKNTKNKKNQVLFLEDIANEKQTNRKKLQKINIQPLDKISLVRFVFCDFQEWGI